MCLVTLVNVAEHVSECLSIVYCVAVAETFYFTNSVLVLPLPPQYMA